MPRLTIATAATAVPMGAQRYEEEVASRAAEALDACGPGWKVDRAIVRSLRSPLQGTHRLPMGWITQASPQDRRRVGQLLYRRDAVVHRMSWELPPAPQADVITVHDVLPWKYPDESVPVRAAREETRRAAAVICVSKFSASEAVDLLGISDPVVVYNGVDEKFFDAAPADPRTLAKLGVTTPYVLAAGGASQRKNLEGLAAAWPRVHSSRPDLTLVLSGPEHPRRTSLFKDLPNVRLVGRVPDSIIPGLISAASALVVPSLYEGFGLPALEGMATGTPVVAARTSSLPEVVGDGGILVAPTPDELAQGILAAVADTQEVARMIGIGRARAREFTWARCAAAHAVVWKSVGANLMP